jgi:RNA polymerase sigma-54 factor
MDLNPALSVSQRTILSPRLFQSLNVLRLDATEIMELVQRELTENPVLELPEPAGGIEESASERELWREYSLANRGRVRTTKSDSTSNAVEATASPTTLAQHLGLQLELKDLPPLQRQVGITIINSLNDAGYLDVPLDQIAVAAGTTVEKVEEVLKIIQGFDPPGVAARDLCECLLNQMRERDRNGLPGRIVKECMPQLARGSFCAIARELSISLSQVEHAITLIRGLNPEPGDRFDYGTPAGAIIPDVFIRQSRDGWAVLANKEITPVLKLSRQCEVLAKSSEDDETYKYLRERRERAQRLIQDLRQRRHTITRVAEAIAEAQVGFFEHGSGCLKPMKLEDIALKLNVSVSTISRAIQGKYMSTPQGIYEFKYFFSSGLSGDSGSELASTAVKQHLKRIIAGEDNTCPLSDRKLADLLHRENIDISRRTVAKYREEMGVPPSCRRKVS